MTPEVFTNRKSRDHQETGRSTSKGTMDVSNLKSSSTFPQDDTRGKDTWRRGDHEPEASECVPEEGLQVGDRRVGHLGDRISNLKKET